MDRRSATARSRAGLLPGALLLAGLAALASGGPRAAGGGDGVAHGSDEADRREILAHVRGLFEAYLARDRDAIRRGHTQDWVGFPVSAAALVRGIDGYMEHAELSLERLRGTGYELTDTELELHGDVALLYYTAIYRYETPSGVPGALPLRSVDVYRREPGGWNQAGSNICAVPPAAPSGPSGPGARELAPAERAELLAAREAVWRAWFAGDEAALADLLPAEVLALDAGGEPWAGRDEVLRRSRAFREAGGRLVRLAFPRTEVRAFGDVAVIFTEYAADLETAEGASAVAGRATELFTRRAGRWVNDGWHLDDGS